MATVTAMKAFSDVQSHAESIRNNETQRFPEAASPGDRIRQGDVYFTLLDALPPGCVPTKIGAGLQLAPGSTQGSRHCLDSADGLTAYLLPNPGPLDGPILVLEQERTVTHPEHGHWTLPGEGRIYAVNYQRNLDAEEREQRVQD